MKIVKKNSAETLGDILAHSIFLKVGRIRKGKIISQEDINLMLQDGIENIYVGEFDNDDLDENYASKKIAEAICVDGVTRSPTYSGKTNITSKYDGLIEIDKEKVFELNRLSTNIAVSTLNNHDIVYNGDHILSVKIISYAINKADLEKIINFLNTNKIIQLKPFKSLKFGVIYTESVNEKKNIIEKTKKSIKSRVSDYNSTIMDEIIVKHDIEAIKLALEKQLTMDIDCLLFFLSSSVADVSDILPSIISEFGGKITSYGMPLDPGNLTLSGYINNHKILVAAGSARSDALNGLDWHLNSLHAGIEIDQDIIDSLGVGGLLKDIDFAVRRKRISKNINTKKANIAAIVLSAGESKRMGEDNKLLLKVNGKTIIANYIENISKSNVSEILVVTGHQSDLIQGELEKYDVNFIYNPDYKDGMSTSLRAGINALSTNIDAAMICLPDMPLIGIYEINKLIDYYNPKIGNEICIATSNEQRGNPVLWDKKYFNELSDIKGDKGGRHLLSQYEEKSVEVNLGEAVSFDVDTKSSYNSLK